MSPVRAPIEVAGVSDPQRRDNLGGAALLVAAVLLFTLESTVVRWLTPGISTSQAVLFRAIGQLLVVAIWAGWRGAWPNLRSHRMGLHAARGMLSVVSWWAYYLTYQRLSIALATVLTYASSLFVVILARPILGERVKRVSWIATLVGFAGIAIAADLTTASISPYVILGLLSAAFSAGIVFLTRTLAQSENTVTIMAWIGIFVLPPALALAWWDWQPLTPSTFAILLLNGAIGAAGMVLMIEAYAIAEAGVLAPIPYVRIIFAIAFGYFIFQEVPGFSMIVGTIIVVFAAFYALHSERRR